MRWSLLLSLVFCLVSTSGCMVLDEIDKANAKMPKTKKKAKVEEPVAAPNGTTEKNALLEQSKQWWDRATSLAPAEVEASIVRCDLRGSTQFMSKDDCLTRGGTPRGVSG